MSCGAGAYHVEQLCLLSGLHDVDLLALDDLHRVYHAVRRAIRALQHLTEGAGTEEVQHAVPAGQDGMKTMGMAIQTSMNTVRAKATPSHTCGQAGRQLYR